jgi:hypothetical protein
MFGRFVDPRGVIRALCKALIDLSRLVLRLNDSELRFSTTYYSAIRHRANLGIRSNRVFYSKPRRGRWHD